MSAARAPGIGDELDWPFKSHILEVADAGGVRVIAVAEHGDIEHVRRCRILQIRA